MNQDKISGNGQRWDVGIVFGRNGQNYADWQSEEQTNQTELSLLVGDVIFTLIEIASTGNLLCGTSQTTGHPSLLMAKKDHQMGRPEYYSRQWTM